MAASRKLMASIDLTMKKVDENIDEFHQMWDKIDDTLPPPQKEKEAAALKKEIKKLQRFREDIMKWLSTPDVKDKQKLIDARKKIEMEMEKFKAYEREAKTKPFSFMGLQMAKDDPRETAKAEWRQKFEEFLEQLNGHLDNHSAQLELLIQANPDKKKKVKKNIEAELTPQQQENLEILKEHMQHHRAMQSQLEQVMRKVENDTIEIEDADQIQNLTNLSEEIQYYFESVEDVNQMVESGDLESARGMLGGIYDEDMFAAFPIEDHRPVDDVYFNDRIGEEEEKPEEKPPPKPAQPAKKAPPKKQGPPPPPPFQPGPPTWPKPPPFRVPDILRTPPEPRDPPPKPPPHIAKLLKSLEEEKEGKEKSGSSGTQPPKAAPKTPPPPTPAVSAPKKEDAKEMEKEKKEEKIDENKGKLQPSSAPVKILAKQPPTAKSAPPPPQAPPPPPPVAEPKSEKLVPTQHKKAPEISKVPSPPAPSVPAPPPPETEEDWIARGLDMSCRAKPVAADSVRKAEYMPNNFYVHTAKNGEAVYPLSEAMNKASPTEMAAMFQHLHVDTLMYIFYYQQGTYAQYLAIKELKRMAWRFHKKYLTWFKRHEEPRATGNGYEHGTFVYFDQENDWNQRIRYDFTFEYVYLEDEPVQEGGETGGQTPGNVPGNVQP